MRALFLSACLLFTLSAFAQSGQGKTDTSIYKYAEKMPEPGYDLPKYLSEHLQYPDSAYKHNIQGRVIVRFVVNKDGSISNCSVIKGYEVANEVLRVVNKMPKWKPGKQKGTPVKVWFTLPIIIDPE